MQTCVGCAGVHKYLHVHTCVALYSHTREALAQPACSCTRAGDVRHITPCHGESRPPHQPTYSLISSLAQVVFKDVKHGQELAEDHHSVTPVMQLGQQPIQHSKLACWVGWMVSGRRVKG